MNLIEIFDKSDELKNHRELFENGIIQDFKIFKSQKKIEIILFFNEIVPKNILISVVKDIKSIYQLNALKIFSRYDSALFSEKYYSEILSYILLKMPSNKRFLEGSEATLENDTITITLMEAGANILTHNGTIDEIIKLIKDEFGLEIKVNIKDGVETEYYDDYAEQRDAQTKEMIELEMAETLENLKEKQKNPIVLGHEIKGNCVSISGLNSESGRVNVTGEVFFMESRPIRGGAIALNMDITDGTSSVTVKKLFSEEEFARISARVKEGTLLKIRGETEYDKYVRDFVIKPYDIMLEEKEQRQDNSESKRVELHLHTKMSAVDGVSDTEALINAAAKWGHKAIAITDHGVLQAYPEAYKIGKKKGIKILFGVECYLVNDTLQIYNGKNDYPLDTEFVIYDVETTGLVATTERITEIGGVKIKNGEVVDRFSEFINPGKPIPPKIVELTGITDKMVADKEYEDTIIPKFIEFIGDSVLVAHNAKFDMGFIYSACERLNIEINNCYLDTLEMARSIYPNLHNHKLDTIAKETGVSLTGHHRAVNDAEALFGIFLVLLEKVREKGITSLKEINTGLVKNTDSARPYHGIILVKNQTGLKNLYKLVTNSNLLHFKRRPRMLKSELIDMREGLIYGSACEAGELYEAFKLGAKYNEIVKIADFYDYLEIQPLGNNQFMIDNGQLKHEDLIRINMDIIKLAKKLNKPVVATGDVHFLNPEDSVYRKIIMAGHGFSDADKQAPLYMRTTEEMLDEFNYLDEKTREEVVITNTNLVADMCDEGIKPIPDEKYPPIIPGSEDEIRNMSYSRAKEIYGDDLPEIVQQRMDKELDSIINNGFSVMYIIAQKLVKKSLDDGYLVGSRGSVGSSFVAFLSGITEVNSLCAHYICPNSDCKHSEFIEDGSYSSGCDMPDKSCPGCGTKLIKDGHDIPFETFLGFEGDKEPDIDLNFSGEYQPIVHKYCEEIFGEGHVFRAGTISTLADKNAFGYVKKYTEERNFIYHSAEMRRLAKGCTGVRKTTGQHPGGVMIVPKENEIYEFCPVARPADDPNSEIVTTHFAYTYLHDCLLKLDLLGHDDPTMIRMLKDITGLDPQTIPIDDEDTMSLFKGTRALGITPESINSKVGTFGVPEFGTKFVRQMLVDTEPETFAELVRISGLSHGTDVWLGNAQEIINKKIATLNEAICTRDDIMIYLIHKGVKPKLSFTIMESVRKGKGLRDDWEAEMKANNVPDWYIDSCKKIKYMFPKAHAVAYVTMAFRIAYYKVHYPLAYYATYFTVRADDFDSEIMFEEYIVMAKIKELEALPDPTTKDKGILTILELCNEMFKRGFAFLQVDLYKSHSSKFTIEDGALRLPFTAIKGLGETAAQTIIEAREEEDFFSKDDLLQRTKISKTILEQMDKIGCTDGLPDSAQITLFDMF